MHLTFRKGQGTMTTTSTVGWVGETLSQRYKVTAKLGEGGMGFVYRALDRETGRDMVVKVPRLEALRSPDFAGRFEREITALLRLDHPHIVKVHNLGRHQNAPFAVMDFLAGGSLREQQFDDIGQAIVMPLPAITTWLGPIADALDFIHEQGYIHRDVKPDNILFDQQGHPFLGDFGVAKLVREEAQPPTQQIKTREGRLMGTPEYMAPELLLGHKYDGQIDQYALGVTLFEMLVGQIPFMDVTETAMMLRQVTEPPPDLCVLRPSIPAALAQAVNRALAKKPEDRFATCQAFSQAVQAALKAEPTQEPSEAEASAAKGVRPMRSIICPACDKRFGVYVHALGRLIRCIQCKKRFPTRPTDGEPLDPALAEAVLNKHRAKTQGGKPVGETRPAARSEGKDTTPLKPFDPFATETESNLRLHRESIPHPFATGEETPMPPPESYKILPAVRDTTPLPRPSTTAPFTPIDATVALSPRHKLPMQEISGSPAKTTVPARPVDEVTIQLKATPVVTKQELTPAPQVTDPPSPRPEEEATIQLKAAFSPAPRPRQRIWPFLAALACFLVGLVVVAWLLLNRP